MAACGCWSHQGAYLSHGHWAPCPLTSLEKFQVAPQHPDKSTWYPSGISREGAQWWQEPSWERRWDVSQCRRGGAEDRGLTDRGSGQSKLHAVSSKRAVWPATLQKSPVAHSAVTGESRQKKSVPLANRMIP